MKLNLAAVSTGADFSAQDKRPRKASSIYQDMKRQIMMGELTTESVITEQALAQDYNCSQSTVREALMTLQEDGLVVRRGYQGTYITETSDDEAVVLIRLRKSIETAAIAPILENISKCDFIDLRRLADAYEENRSQRKAFHVSEMDLAFHLRLLRVANMPVLEPILLRTLLHLHRFVMTRHIGNLQWVKDIQASHHEILDALESGDKELALHLMNIHTTETSSVEIEPAVKARIQERTQSLLD